MRVKLRSLRLRVRRPRLRRWLSRLKSAASEQTAFPPLCRVDRGARNVGHASWPRCNANMGRIRRGIIGQLTDIGAKHDLAMDIRVAFHFFQNRIELVIAAKKSERRDRRDFCCF